MKRDELLKELGQAWRGDWSDFDGRTLRAQLNNWLDLPEEVTPDEAHRYRESEGLCLEGGGHWDHPWGYGHTCKLCEVVG